jgi:glycerophosphoryl diester phosphodiesterase
VTMVSAHEYGALNGRPGANAAELISEVLALSADFVELDGRRPADGVFVIRHERFVSVDGEPHRIDTLTHEELRSAVDVLSYADALRLLAGRGRAHLDLKLSPPESSYDGADDQTWEVRATAEAIAVLGTDQLVVTTGQDKGIAALRRWSEAACPGLMVGLSLGGSHAGQSLRRQAALRWSELFPARRVAACDANVVVANKWLAQLGVARWAHRAGIPLLVWTVDDTRGLRRWLGDPRCWMVTTNNVREAVRIRDGYRD